MLSELTIEQVAVIEKASVSFDKGFQVLTGETGAGKSIIIDSINAILGNRTSKELVRSGAAKAVIYAVFDFLRPITIEKLEKAGYPIEDQLFIQREISAEGKSTCRINGKPAPASLLRDICIDLITIHGQHDNQTLLDASKHLSLLDSYAKLQDSLGIYQEKFHQLVSLEKQIQKLSKQEDGKEERIDLLQYQINEIDAADLQEEEEEVLLQRRDALRNARNIAHALSTAYSILTGDENQSSGVIDLFSDGCTSLESIQEYSSDLKKISECWYELYYQMQDLSLLLHDEVNRIAENPDELTETEERLNCIYQLKQKYGKNISEILAFSYKAKEELHCITTSDEELDILIEQRDSLYKETRILAKELTRKRLNAFQTLAKELQKTLAFLNMPDVRFTLSHKEGSLTIHGQDTLEFYIITNRGEQPKPLAKIASGGELSRIMLAFKNVLATVDEIDTVIYDEIDTGVSGTAAGRIGEVLHSTSIGRQVICITHTAQIAAQADRHIFIKKSVDQDKTYTEIHLLNEEERAAELARIISGDHITPLAMASAKEMLSMRKKEDISYG